MIFNRKKIDLLILDDILPSNLSPWRSYEFDKLCEYFPNTKIYYDLSTYKNYNQDKSIKENLALLTTTYPDLKNKIFKNSILKNKNSKLVYTIFYNNICKHFDFIKKNNLDFVFTLYPGGGFVLNDEEVNTKLKTIFSNKGFKKVIVNQYITKKYLLENNLCNSSKITLIPGVPLKIDSYINAKEIKKSDITNILFFANKYTDGGIDKGFDIFEEIVAHFKDNSSIHFHVIGGFTPNDLKDIELNSKINFLGILSEGDFDSHLKKMHIAISPNKPFILNKGAFDGFPLATSVTSSLYGLVNLMSDYFNESNHLSIIEGVHFYKIDENISHIIRVINNLHLDRNLMNNIAFEGRNKVISLYSFENQITPRINLFKELLF